MKAIPTVVCFLIVCASAIAQTDLAAIQSKARALFSAGNFEESAREWKRAVALNAGDIENRLNCGVALDALGRYKEANEELTAAARIQATPQVLNNLAVNLVHLERIPEAIQTLEQLLRVDPKNAKALFNLASIYAAKGLWDLAVEALTKLSAITGGDATTRVKLAEANRSAAEEMLRQGKLQESLSHFQSALELTPDDPAAYLGLSLTLLRGNAPDAAISLLEDATRKFAGNARIAIALGYAFESNSGWEKAAEWYRKAILLEPSSAIAQVALARVLQQSGDREGAIKILRAAVNVNPRSAAACYELGNSLLLSDPQNSEGFALMERTAALAPERAEPKYLLAKSALARDDLKAAKRWALLAVQADPSFAAPHYLLGTIHRRLGDVALAEVELGIFQKMEKTRLQGEDKEMERALQPHRDR